MLRNLACRLVMEDHPPARLKELVLAAAELCLARYPYCRPLLLHMVNEKLERIGAEPVSMEEFTDAEALLDTVRQRVREYSVQRLLQGRRHASREQLAEAVEATALRIVYGSLLAVLDLLGVECPLTRPGQALQT